jgi:hypothetical protein
LPSLNQIQTVLAQTQNWYAKLKSSLVTLFTSRAFTPRLHKTAKIGQIFAVRLILPCRPSDFL